MADSRKPPMGGELNKEDISNTPSSSSSSDVDELSRRVQRLLALEEEECPYIAAPETSTFLSDSQVHNYSQSSAVASQYAHHEQFAESQIGNYPQSGSVGLQYSLHEKFPDSGIGNDPQSNIIEYSHQQKFQTIDNAQSADITNTAVDSPFIFEYRQRIDIKLPLPEKREDQYLQSAKVDYEHIHSYGSSPSNVTYKANMPYENQEICINQRDSQTLYSQQQVCDKKSQHTPNYDFDESAAKDYNYDIQSEKVPHPLEESSDRSVRPKDKFYFRKNKKPHKKRGFDKRREEYESSGVRNLDNIPLAGLPENIPLNPHIRWYPHSFKPADICEAGTQTSVELADAKVSSPRDYTDVNVHLQNMRSSESPYSMQMEYNVGTSHLSVMTEEDESDAIISSDLRDKEKEKSSYVRALETKITTKNKFVQSPVHSSKCSHQSCTSFYTKDIQIQDQLEAKEDIKIDPDFSISFHRKFSEKLKVASPAKYKIDKSDSSIEDYSKSSSSYMRKDAITQTSFPQEECDCIEKLRKRMLVKLSAIQYDLEQRMQMRAKEEEANSEVQNLPVAESSFCIIPSEYDHSEHRSSYVEERVSAPTYRKKLQCHRRQQRFGRQMIIRGLRATYRERAKRYSKALARYATQGVVNHPLHRRILEDKNA